MSLTVGKKDKDVAAAPSLQALGENSGFIAGGL